MVVQGLELQALRQQPGFGRIVYCGDGANDLCPALMLGTDDYVRCLNQLRCICICALVPMMSLGSCLMRQVCMCRSLRGMSTH